MKVLRKVLFLFGLSVCLSLSASAQKNDGKKPPPKGTPPVVIPQPKNPPPRENPDPRKGKRPNSVIYLSENSYTEEA
jgi:hypothetical protein